MPIRLPSAPESFVRRSVRFASWCVLSALASAACGPKADLAVFGRVWTGDSATPWAGAVAVRGDTILAVGDSAEIARLVGRGTERIDNGSDLVVPGFLDDHVHLFSGGFQLTSVDLKDADSPEELVRRVREHVSRLAPGEWMTGGDWDHERWPGTMLPDRSWIDSVTPRNPVFLSRYDGHMWLANSLALAAAGLDRSAREIPGGEILRRRDGELTGVLKDEAGDPVFTAIPAPSASQLDSALARAMRHAASLGVTGLVSVTTSWPEIAALHRAEAAGTLTFRVSNYVPLSQWRSAADTLRVRGPGNDWIRTAGVKGVVDGSLGSTTALFDDPYLDAPRSRGLFTTSEDSLRQWIGAADSAGLHVVVHAIGDRANGVLLDIFDSVATAHGPRDRRFRVEHAQHLRPADIPRFAALGVIPSMQPYHAVDDGRWAAKRIGARIRTTYAFRSLLDAEARLVFGSDWTVAPLDPVQGIKAAVTRQTLDGQHPEGWVPEEKISVEETLRAYTVNNAYAVFAEHSRGRISPGYLADLVLLDRDLFRVAAPTLDSARVRATIVGGTVVYRRP
jgi:predicted amidohydrolase YtcJ